MSTYKNFQPGDYIKLNVGGKKFLTSYSTLTKYNSMLNAMITGEIPVCMDEKGYIIIDRDGSYFNLLLNFLRDGEIDLPKDEHARRLILREADFYNFQVLIDYINVQTRGEESIDYEHIEIIKDLKTIVGHILANKIRFYLILKLQEWEGRKNRRKNLQILIFH